MRPEALADALERLNLCLIGCSTIENDSTLPGRTRVRIAQIKKHIDLVAKTIREDKARDHNDHLGAVADANQRERTGNGD